MGISFWHLVVVLVVVLIVFGAGRLPKVMGDMGKGIKQFKDGLDGKEPSGESKQIAADKTDKKD